MTQNKSKYTVFSEGEPVMVVEGGWGLFPKLEGKIITVKAARIEDMKSDCYEMAVAAEIVVDEERGWDHKVGDTFAPCSIRKLTSEELEEYYKSEEAPSLEYQNTVLRARVWELEQKLRKIQALSEVK